MKRLLAPLLALSAGPALAVPDAAAVREVAYDARAVIRVPVARGVATHIELEPGEQIRMAASGMGSDCARPEHAWCVVASEGTSHVFAKPKAGAGASNTLALVTDRRSYSLQLDVVPPARAAQRVVVRVPPPPALDPELLAQRQRVAAALAMAPHPAEVLEQRLALRPQVLNADYTVATGKASSDLVPRAVFDDGRFTYFQFPGNREVPAAFQVEPDGSESLVNVRMEGDLLVVDRVARRLVLRAGHQVVAVRNEAFDAEGRAPVAGSAAEGVQRLVRHSRTGQFREVTQP